MHIHIYIYIYIHIHIYIYIYTWVHIPCGAVANISILLNRRGGREPLTIYKLGLFDHLPQTMACPRQAK